MAPTLQQTSASGARLGLRQMPKGLVCRRLTNFSLPRKSVVAAAGKERDVSAKAAEAVVHPSMDPSDFLVGAEERARWAAMSYSQQYDEIMKRKPLNTKKVVPKPSKAAMEAEPLAQKKVFMSDLVSIPKRHWLVNREWNAIDLTYLSFIGGMHVLALAAPFTFSWDNLALFLGLYFVTGCLGITLSYHRMLSHKSFEVPKWLEYPLAYCGMLAVQGDPIEWSSTHRYHHLHSDTPLDPHSPYEGFWWCHMGWLLDNQATMERVSNRGNARDLEEQPFYRWLRDTFMYHVAAQFLVLYLIGGFPAMIWGGALRIVWVWHITWCVNSATHAWGYQTYNTGDLARNNWWIGILAFGEGWHNNHHAFEFSARHGLEWFQIDVTYYIIAAMEKLGLATKVKLPSERQKQKLLIKKPEATAA